MASPRDLEERLRAALAHRYRIERELGSGGMATVYLAEDLKHRRKVAVKVLKPELAQAVGAERFLREIEVAANLLHPHILPVFDSGEADGLLFYVMPRVRGGSLRDRLEEEKQLPVEEAVTLAREVADALSHAHERDVVHRDVKPGNILLAGGHALLTDFGVAQAVAHAGKARLTQTGMSLGTPAYMSPEQAAGERDLDGRSDQYALGCVFYEMLAGQPPFTGAKAETVVRQHLTAAPPEVTQLRPTVPSGLTEVLAKALSKAPADRFTTAREFGRALQALYQTPSGGVKAVSGSKGRPARMMGILGVAVAAIVALLVWKPWQQGTEGGVSPENTGPPPWTILAEVEGSAPEELRAAVRDLLSGDIDASGAVQVIPEGQLQRGLAAALMPDTTRVTLPVAKELAERHRIGTVFAPELDRVGDSFVLTLRILFPVGDGVLDTKRVTAVDENDLIVASGTVVEDLRPALGAWVGDGVRPPLEDPPVTASMEAFRKLGEASGQTGAFSLRIAKYREALAIDPEFAEAWSRLGATFTNAGFPDSALYARQQALKHPERLSERRRLWLEAIVAGDEVGRFRLAESEYRRTGRVTIVYATALADIMGRYEEAVDRFAEMAEQSVFGISPNSHWNWAHYLLALGRVDEAKHVAVGLDGTARETPLRATIALREGSWAEAEELGMEVARDRARDIRWRSDASRIIASSRAVRGRMAESVAALHQLIEINEHPGRYRNLLSSHLDLLLLRMASGLELEAWQHGGLEGDRPDRARAIQGLWAAALGDVTEAESYVERLPPLDLSEFDLPDLDASLIAALHASLAGLRGDWDESVRLLVPVTGHRAPRTMRSTRLPNWIRAEAEEELGHLEEAAELYAQIANGYRFGDYEVHAFGLTYSFAHRRAALLYGRLGERDKAIEHWRAFLEAFTDPDPEFEWMVEEGREELARLGG